MTDTPWRHHILTDGEFRPFDIAAFAEVEIRNGEASAARPDAVAEIWVRDHPAKTPTTELETP